MYMTEQTDGKECSEVKKGGVRIRKLEERKDK